MRQKTVSMKKIVDWREKACLTLNISPFPILIPFPYVLTFQKSHVRRTLFPKDSAPLKSSKKRWEEVTNVLRIKGYKTYLLRSDFISFEASWIENSILNVFEILDHNDEIFSSKGTNVIFLSWRSQILGP